MISVLLRLSTAVLIGLSTSLSAADWYVDVQGGSDIQGDGSSQSPWKTITHALSQVGSGSQRILVRPGLYDTAAGEIFPIQVSAGITLESTSGASETTIRGFPTTDVIQMVGTAQDCFIIGFGIENGRAGISVRTDTAFATIANNTISSNTLAGIEAGVHQSPQGQNLRVTENRIEGNTTGFLSQGSAIGVESKNNRIALNEQDGVFLTGRAIVNCDGDIIRLNGGWGLQQKFDISGFIQTSLTNTTISSNQTGGVYTYSNQFCQYIPYIGWFCDDPVASVSALLCTVYGNGGDGLRRAGTSAGSHGFISLSIAWGNSGIDNFNFTDAHSDIGTGSMIHPKSFSLPPLMVDPQQGDFRLRKDSPCVDQSANIGPDDAEGEPRDLDGDSDGLGKTDLGSDEFHPYVAPGTRAVIGQPFWFFSEAPPADDGQFVFVMISTADGEDSGGIPVPGSQGQRVDLAPDWLFQLGLTVQPALSGTLQNGFAQTATVTLPNSTQFLGPVYYAGATIDLAAGQFKYITPTHQFSIATQ